MKIVNIIGARPQFIKYFPVSRAISEINNSSGTFLEEILIHTGQHYDYEMSDIFIKELHIKKPDYYLGVGSGTHGVQTGEILQRVEEVLLKEGPDIVLVYGDTNSTLGSALAAVKIHIPVAHVEAGLRSYNKHMPEEINRVLTDHVSTILFCPTRTAVENLRREGFGNLLSHGKFSNSHPLVTNVGDVMYDVIRFAVGIAEKTSKILEVLDIEKKEYCLLTLHRAENTDSVKRLKEFLKFVDDVSAGRTVIFPLHPRTKKVFDAAGIKVADNLKIIDPLGYYDMAWLLRNSKLVFTDSGGLQKEAYWLKVPCITLRDETEWIETVQTGWNVLYKNYKGHHKPSIMDKGFYGDGNAGKKIISTLLKYDK